MAIDTRAKRMSITNMMQPFQTIGIVPDGDITQGDRQAFMWMYSGVLAKILSIGNGMNLTFTVLKSGVGVSVKKARTVFNIKG